MSAQTFIPSDTARPYRFTREAESSWEDFLSEAHQNFILAYIEAAQAREEAAISQLLKKCPLTTN
jgi:hypothetical protein